MTQDQTANWWDLLADAFKANNIKLISYVPDKVLIPLIDLVHRDPYFDVVPAVREEEAVGIVSGAWMAGMPGAVLMQTSGFATLPNVIASLAVPAQIPLVMVVSERGTMGEFNLGQSLVARVMRPVLDALCIEHHTLTRKSEVFFVAEQSIKQALLTQASVTFILSPLLTHAAAPNS